MGPIIWDESFSGGVQKIDQQQKMLIAMINKLIEAQDASIRSETISDIVTRMTGYAQYHFWTKEKLILVPYQQFPF
ncbi:MAG: hypothetical protein U9Q82_09035 [Chloroflexota bacterium]|nr:hypothetical protein [Chloroflexota bacterium]